MGSPADKKGNQVSKLGKWLEESEWIDRGLVLGALGGLAGFLTSGLVHYNWGDSEVVMIFYFIMGLSLAVWKKVDSEAQEVAN